MITKNRKTSHCIDHMITEKHLWWYGGNFILLLIKLRKIKEHLILHPSSIFLHRFHDNKIYLIIFFKLWEHITCDP